MVAEHMPLGRRQDLEKIVPDPIPTTMQTLP